MLDAFDDAYGDFSGSLKEKNHSIVADTKTVVTFKVTVKSERVEHWIFC